MSNNLVKRATRRIVNLFVGQGTTIVPFGRSRNLSLSGLFLETSSRPAIGDIQNISFVWGDETYLCAARIVRHAGDGIALTFVNPDAGFMYAIQDILKSSPPVELQAAGFNIYNEG